jgi:hypothetical protein
MTVGMAAVDGRRSEGSPGVAQLQDIAAVIRSKNAGPYQVTFDVLFDDDTVYRRVSNAKVLTPESVAARLGIDCSDVAVYEHPLARALKVTVRRKAPAGSVEDSDLYGAQQHVWLYDIEVPDRP